MANKTKMDFQSAYISTAEGAANNFSLQKELGGMQGKYF